MFVDARTVQTLLLQDINQFFKPLVTFMFPKWSQQGNNILGSLPKDFAEEKKDELATKIK